VVAVVELEGTGVDVSEQVGREMFLVARSRGGFAHRHRHMKGGLYLWTGKKRKKRRPGGRLCLSMAPTYYWIVSCFAAAVAFLGSVSSSTPSAYLALARASSISWPSRKARDTVPK